MEKANVIDINMDRECSMCGAKGATQGGLCLECVAERIEKSIGPIGEKTILKVADQVHTMLRSHLLNINAGYRNEETLTIGFSSKIEPGTGGDLVVTTKIKFVESSVKDEMQDTVDEAQSSLF